jgi:hypothetical protein
MEKAEAVEQTNVEQIPSAPDSRQKSAGSGEDVIVQVVEVLDPETVPDVCSTKDVAHPRWCKKIKEDGKQCQAFSLRDSDFCLAHANENERGLVSFGGAQPNAGRPPKPKQIQIVEDIIREKYSDIENVLKDGLQADKALVVGHGASAHLEYIPDSEHRLKVINFLFDRTIGKAKVTMESHSKTENLSIILDAKDDDTRKLLRSTLASTRNSSI